MPVKSTYVPSVEYTRRERERFKNLDYMLGRHYSHVTNRFMSVDPARDGWNLYGYAGGNPVRLIDADGLKVVEPKKRGRLGRAYRKFKATRRGASAIKTLEDAEGTYTFERKDSKLTARERFEARKFGKQTFKKTTGHFVPSKVVVKADGSKELLSGCVIQVDFAMVDRAAEEPYSGDDGDVALMGHEVGHAVAHEEAEDRWAYHLQDYEVKEGDADELRDAVVQELEQDN